MKGMLKQQSNTTHHFHQQGATLCSSTVPFPAGTCNKQSLHGLWAKDGSSLGCCSQSAEPCCGSVSAHVTSRPSVCETWSACEECGGPSGFESHAAELCPRVSCNGHLLAGLIHCVLCSQGLHMKFKPRNGWQPTSAPAPGLRSEE